MIDKRERDNVREYLRNWDAPAGFFAAALLAAYDTIDCLEAEVERLQTLVQTQTKD